MNRLPCLNVPATVLGLYLLQSTTAFAQTASAPTTPASAASQAKDIVMDAPVAPVPLVAAPVSTASPLPANTAPTAGRRRVAGPALADLGLHLIRQSTQSAGNARSNTVVSPFSVALALGMLQTGAAGSTASEIAGVLESESSGGRLLASGLGDLSQAIRSDASSQWLSANRIWVAKGAAKDLSPSFLSRLKTGYAADGVVLDFAGSADSARQTINSWASDATQKHIAELLPPGSIKPNSKIVLTNAAYFKGQWSSPLDPANTRPAPFTAESGNKDVATMHGVVSAWEGTIDNIYVLELSFEGDQFSLMLALPPKEHTVQALQDDLLGADIAGWSGQLKPQRVRLALPKFSIKGASVALNDALKAAGMKTAFGNGADFSGVFKGGALKLDSVFHAAAIDVNEEGATASAATSAVAIAKSLPAAEPPLRVFNRPFVFVLLHKPTSAPLFIGRVAQP